jgi:hypothetical protein
VLNRLERKQRGGGSALNSLYKTNKRKFLAPVVLSLRQLYCVAAAEKDARQGTALDFIMTGRLSNFPYKTPNLQDLFSEKRSKL